LIALIILYYPINGQTADATNTQIDRLIETGKLREAQERLGSIIKTTGESPSTMLLEARLLFKQQRFIESIKKLETLLAATGGSSLKSLDAEAHKLMGLNLVLINRLDLAEPFLKDSVAMRPNDYLARFHLGMLYYTSSRFSAAETELRETVKLTPEFAKGYDALGLTLEELGKDEAALGAYRRAIELSGKQKLKDASPYLNLGKFLLAKNRYEESLPLLEKAITLDPGSAEAAFQLGKTLSKFGRESAAIRALQQAIQNNPDYAEPHYLLSRIYLNQGREEEAVREMRIFQELRQMRQRKP
jgi:tetratricopeptide (TPR) repeat protein